MTPASLISTGIGTIRNRYGYRRVRRSGAHGDVLNLNAALSRRHLTGFRRDRREAVFLIQERARRAHLVCCR